MGGLETDEEADNGAVIFFFSTKRDKADQSTGSRMYSVLVCPGRVEKKKDRERGSCTRESAGLETRRQGQVRGTRSGRGRGVVGSMEHGEMGP